MQSVTFSTGTTKIFHQIQVTFDDVRKVQQKFLTNRSKLLHNLRCYISIHFITSRCGKILEHSKISFSFRFVATSRNKLFHISVMSHNVQVKLWNLYQFAKAFNGIASCKIFCPSFMFHHFMISCIWLMLFLYKLKQFSFINRNVFCGRRPSLDPIT